MYHSPVLLGESVEALAIQGGGVYVDVTFGGGGHSRKILEVMRGGKLIAFDQDADALENKIEDERLELVNQNFKYLKNYLKLYNILEINGLLADLGVSSHQFDEPARGFSFRENADLDMRMDATSGISAKEVVNGYSQEELKRIFKEYGEVRNAGYLASVIVNKRSEKEIQKTHDLIEVIACCANRKTEVKYFAQVFQAIRIEVNKELDVLKDLLNQCVDVIATTGRLVVISYHSLEDRLVKNFMKSGNFEGVLSKDLYGNVLRPFDPLYSKVIVPSDDELVRNKRARSAKLRVAVKR